MMAMELYFYSLYNVTEGQRGRYTVGKYLDDVDRRYGGIDSLLLWHSYPK